MAKNSAQGLLTTLDDLFSTQEEREVATQPRVQDISIDLIDEFPNHPFKVRMDESMMEMADSVKQHGILVPAIIRPKKDGRYEMVAGHRRMTACMIAEKEALPCLVRDLTDEEATIIMVDSNLQREQLLPSEKAFAYKMKLDALKRQGKRTDLTSSPLDNKLKGITAAQQISEKSGDSQPQIYRYIRLTALIPELLDLVDNSCSERKRKAANCPAACGRAVLSDPAGTAGSSRNHADRGLYSLSCASHQNAEVLRGRQTEYGCYLLHHAGGETQPEGTIQDSQRPYQQVFCAGDACAED